jgi:hypothetical protein
MNVQRRQGWILPAAGKILVNVSCTDDIDVWKGQVEDGDEHGTFLRAFP